MSLNIKDAVYGLGTKLGVDMSHAPASNIADTIDYISNSVGAHTGVIAEAVDKLEISGGGSTFPDEIFLITATKSGSSFILDKTWDEINTAFYKGTANDPDQNPLAEHLVCIVRIEDGDIIAYDAVSVCAHETSSSGNYVVRIATLGGAFWANNTSGYPTMTS